MLFSHIGFGQFTASNSPVIGNQDTLYVLDSTATSFADIIGEGVTWDYSELDGYTGATKTIKVLGVEETNYDTIYTSSSHAIQIEDHLISYFSDPASEKYSQGFVFLNANPTIPLESVGVAFSTDEAKYFTYPMQFGDVIEDDYAGQANVHVLGSVIAPDMAGQIHIELDGKGTLLIGDNTYSNVLRYKVVESASAFVTAFNDSAKYNRTQYEYYEFTVSNLPIFIHSSVQFGLAGNTLIDVNLVLSKEQANSFVRLDDEQEKFYFTMYPNPADRKSVV